MHGRRPRRHRDGRLLHLLLPADRIPRAPRRGGHRDPGPTRRDRRAADLRPLTPKGKVEAAGRRSELLQVPEALRRPELGAVAEDAPARAETARAASPLFWPAPAHGQPFEAWVGGDETSEFHRQSQELAKAWSRQGVDAVYRSLPGTNHYNVIAALADKESLLSARLVALARD